MENIYLSVNAFNNIYLFGTYDASLHIVDTGDGLIMFDTGYLKDFDTLIEKMGEFNLKVEDVKLLLLTHGHIDHIDCAKIIRDMSGCQIFIGDADKDYVNGKLNLTWADEVGVEYKYPFEADKIIYDGDIITLGNTTVKCINSPGHTPGATTYIFNTGDYIASLHGGCGFNSMKKAFLDKYGLSYDCRDDFIKSCDRLKEEKVDIVLGNHLTQNKSVEKAEMVKNGNKDAFVDKEEWVSFLEGRKQALIKMVESGE